MWPLVAGIVVACVLLGGGAGGAAYLLTREDGELQAEVFPGENEPYGADDDDVIGDDSATEIESDQTAGDTGDAEPLAGQTRFEQAHDVWLQHWQALDEGRYEDAFELFHPGYDVDRAGWIASHEDEATDVNVDAIVIRRGTTSPLGGEYWLDVRVPLRDYGGAYAGECRLFYGEVRMVRSGSRYLYRPGEYRGRMGSFGRSDLGGGVRTLPDADSRCP